MTCQQTEVYGSGPWNSILCAKYCGVLGYTTILSGWVMRHTHVLTATSAIQHSEVICSMRQASVLLPQLPSYAVPLALLAPVLLWLCVLLLCYCGTQPPVTQ